MRIFPGFHDLFNKNRGVHCEIDDRTKINRGIFVDSDSDGDYECNLSEELHHVVGKFKV